MDISGYLRWVMVGSHSLSKMKATFFMTKIGFFLEQNVGSSVTPRLIQINPIKTDSD